MKVIRYGFKSPVVAIIGGLHGNEKIGVQVIEKLGDLRINGSIKCIIANEEALQLNQRFIDSDLNRSFASKTTEKHEEQLAPIILKELVGVDYVFDIHSTTADTDDFIITVGKNELTKNFPLLRVVDMGAFARGVSLIETVPCGISLEYNQRTSADEIVKQLCQCLVNIGLLEGLPKHFPQEQYHVYGILEKSVDQNIVLENFLETEQNGERFVPILYGEEAYAEVLCLKARRTDH